MVITLFQICIYKLEQYFNIYYLNSESQVPFWRKHISGGIFAGLLLRNYFCVFLHFISCVYVPSLGRKYLFPDCLPWRYQTGSKVIEWTSEARSLKSNGNSIEVHWNHEILLIGQTVESKIQTTAQLISTKTMFFFRLGHYHKDNYYYQSLLVEYLLWCLINTCFSLVALQYETVKFITVSNTY